MYRCAEEHARRTVQLAYDYALSTVDDECTFRCHIRHRTEEHVLDDGIEILMIRIGARQFEFSLQRHGVGQATLDTLLNGVTRMVDIIVQKLKVEAVACVGDREVLHKHLVQAFMTALFRSRLDLEEIMK